MRLGDTTMPIAIDVALSNRDRAAAVEFALRNREHWETVADSPLHSLGFPGYRFKGDRAEYLAQVIKRNDGLRRQLRPVYESVLAALSDALGERVSLVAEVAHPGLHILTFDRLPEYDPGDPHCDSPYVQIPWLRTDDIDPEGNLSFTLPLLLPSAGSGLEVYDHWVAQAKWKEIDWESEPRQHIPYRLGSLYLLRGSRYHRIAPTTGNAGESRITIQGHLLRMGANLIAYW